MRYKHTRFLLVTLILMVLLASCTRIASTPIPKLVEKETEVNAPGLTDIAPTTQTIEIVETQTTIETNLEPTSEAPAIAETPITETIIQATVEPTEVVVPPVLVEELPEVVITSEVPLFPIFEGYGNGYATFGIRGVVRDQTVTIQANDFPPDQTYVVKMGPMNAGAVDEYVADTKETGKGGTFLVTINFPEEVKGADQIAIRIEFTNGRYAVNWFWNVTTY